MEKQIYLVLTQTSSVLSRMIKIFTGAEYNHISLAFSQDLEPMWSFGRRHPYNPFWGGFVKEHIKSGTFLRFPKTKCAVLSVAVPEETFFGMKKMVEEMHLEQHLFGYNFTGLCFAAAGRRFSRKNKFYCSEFIQSVFVKFHIAGSENFETVVQPSHFLTFPNATLLYRGKLSLYPYQALPVNRIS